MHILIEMKNKTIILTGGGTAGHVTPNLNLIPDLKKYFDKIIYIGSKTGIEKSLISQTNIEYHEITTCKFVRKKIICNLLIPFKLIKGINEAKKILKENKANVIFSKGGFVSVPVVMAGKKLKIPIIAHESDKSPGLANKICAKKCKIVFTSFEDTASKIKNGQYSGPPLAPIKNNNREQIKRALNLHNNKPVLLITGGSSGAVALNKAIEQILPELTKEYQVIHLVGKGNNVNYENKEYHKYEYSNQMPQLMSITDYAITRGGSNTIFELANHRIPMIIVPLPKGNSRGDQEENAIYFEKKGLSLTLWQKNLSPTSIIQTLKDLQKMSKTIQKNQSNQINNEANNKIIKAILENAK